MTEKEKRFWTGVFSEPDGTPSFSRVATAVLIAITSGLLIYVVLKTSAFPEMSVLAGLAAFITTLYATNKTTEKGSDILGSLKGLFAPKEADKPADIPVPIPPKPKV
jgi:hypothetical protein